jgi:hypothetical protein
MEWFAMHLAYAPKRRISPHSYASGSSTVRKILHISTYMVAFRDCAAREAVREIDRQRVAKRHQLPLIKTRKWANGCGQDESQDESR